MRCFGLQLNSDGCIGEESVVGLSQDPKPRKYRYEKISYHLQRNEVTLKNTRSSQLHLEGGALVRG